ncbi:MAG: hypothetical protein JZU59_02615 [Chromatium okenii]|nr:hypothetical protein [Chromatium okenii]
MNYAARMMWPEKSATWDYLGAAESLDDFAMMYATDKALAVGAEFVVIEKGGADSDIQFFKVSRADPYGLIPADPRVESGGSSVSATTATAAPQEFMQEQSIGEVWKAMYSNIFFFGRVSGTAFLVFLAFIGIAKWFDLW